MNKTLTLEQKKLLLALVEAGSEDLVVLLNTHASREPIFAEVANFLSAVRTLISSDLCVLSCKWHAEMLQWDNLPIERSFMELLDAANSIKWDGQRRYWVWAREDYRIEVILTALGIGTCKTILSEEGWII